jgi:hypothetical protein
LTIDGEDDIGADNRTDAASGASALAFVKLHRTITARVELFSKSQDVLRTCLNAQATALAAIGLDGDSAFCHECSPLSDSSALAHRAEAWIALCGFAAPGYRH